MDGLEEEARTHARTYAQRKDTDGSLPTTKTSQSNIFHSVIYWNNLPQAAVAGHSFADGLSVALQPSSLFVEQVTAPVVPEPDGVPQAVSQSVAASAVQFPVYY